MQLFFLLFLENFKVKTSLKQCCLEADKNRGGGSAAHSVCGDQREKLEPARGFWEKEIGIDCKTPADLNAGQNIAFLNSCYCVIRKKSSLLSLIMLSLDMVLYFSVKQTDWVALEVQRIISFKKLMANISIVSTDNSKLQLYFSQHVSSKYSKRCFVIFLIA